MEGDAQSFEARLYRGEHVRRFQVQGPGSEAEPHQHEIVPGASNRRGDHRRVEAGTNSFEAGTNRLQILCRLLLVGLGDFHRSLGTFVSQIVFARIESDDDVPLLDSRAFWYEPDDGQILRCTDRDGIQGSKDAELRDLYREGAVLDWNGVRSGHRLTGRGIPHIPRCRHSGAREHQEYSAYAKAAFQGSPVVFVVGTELGYPTSPRIVVRRLRQVRF